jgi:hypothetical protein
LPFLVDASNADAAKKQTFEFTMVPTSGAIRNCLPDATAEVTIKDAKVNQIMKVKAEGLAPNTPYGSTTRRCPSTSGASRVRRCPL